MFHSTRIDFLNQMVETAFSRSEVPSYYNHTLRVANYASQIAVSEHKDAEVIAAAALIHDIGMSKEANFATHIQTTKEIAPAMLSEARFSTNEIDDICRIAAAHHPDPHDVLKDSEETIIFDADWLDLVGILGFMRWYGRIPDKLSDMLSSAHLLSSIVKTARDTRGSLFYTKLARTIGEPLVDESLCLTKALAEFLKDAIANDTLTPASFQHALGIGS